MSIIRGGVWDTFSREHMVNSPEVFKHRVCEGTMVLAMGTTENRPVPGDQVGHLTSNVLGSSMKPACLGDIHRLH